MANVATQEKEKPVVASPFLSYDLESYTIAKTSLTEAVMSLRLV